MSDPDMPTPFDDTQPDLPLMGDAPGMPLPASTGPMNEPPPFTPARRNNTLLLAIIGGVVALALILGGVALAVTRAGAATTPPTPTAASILDHASKATLQDAKFTLQGSVALMSAPNSPSTRIDLTGNGAFTATPARADVSLTIPLLGSQDTLEAFVDTDVLYLKAPALLQFVGVTTDKWIKLPANTLPANMTSITDLTELYKQIQNPQLIGTDTINSTSVWHISGTLNTEQGTPTTKPTGTPTPTGTPGLGGVSTTPVTVDLWLTKDHYYPLQIKFHTTITAPAFSLPTGFPGIPGLPGTPTSTPAATATPTPVATGTPTTTTSTVDLTVLFSNWNTGAQLTPPSPADVIDVGNLPGIPGIPGQPTPTPTAPPSS